MPMRRRKDKLLLLFLFLLVASYPGRRVCCLDEKICRCCRSEERKVQIQMERIDSFSILYNIEPKTEQRERQQEREKRRALYIYLDYLYLLQDFRLKIVDNGRNTDDQGCSSTR
jgi:hypothetical protein